MPEGAGHGTRTQRCFPPAAPAKLSGDLSRAYRLRDTSKKSGKHPPEQNPVLRASPNSKVLLSQTSDLKSLFCVATTVSASSCQTQKSLS